MHSQPQLAHPIIKRSLRSNHFLLKNIIFFATTCFAVNFFRDLPLRLILDPFGEFALMALGPRFCFFPLHIACYTYTWGARIDFNNGLDLK